MGGAGTEIITLKRKSVASNGSNGQEKRGETDFELMEVEKFVL